jgi:hypothetical protein
LQFLASPTIFVSQDLCRFFYKQLSQLFYSFYTLSVEG